MSKKNRRKTLTKKEGYIRKGEFSVDDSKIYIILTIVMFHIVPLAFVMMGENGQQILMLTFLMMLNPIFIVITGLIYGIKKGFNYKFPMFMGIIATVSVLMYYDFDSIVYKAQTVIIMMIVYIIFALLSTVIGGWLKKLLNF